MRIALAFALALATAAPALAQSPGGGLAQLLTSSAWCSFTYNQRTGTSRQERVAFNRDGTLVQTSGAETHSSGRSGTVAGQHSGGSRGFWRVQGNVLHLSEDRAKWEPQPLVVTKNSNGYPIIKSEGKEYMQCK